MARDLSEVFYGRDEPHWMVQSQKEIAPQLDRRGCVRHTQTGYRNDYSTHTPARGGNLPTRSGYAYQQPSMLAGDRPAAVYNNPVTHRSALDTTVNMPIVEFMVPLCCGKCEEKVKEELEITEGVYKVVCDQHNQRVTVTSILDPQRLLKRVKRVKKKSEFWNGRTQLKNVHVPRSKVDAPPHSVSSHQAHRLDFPYKEHGVSLWTRSENPNYQEGPAFHMSPTHVSPCRASYDGQDSPAAAFSLPARSSTRYGHFATTAHSRTYEDYPSISTYY